MKKLLVLTLLIMATPVTQAEDTVQELDAVVVTAPLQETASDLATPVTVLSDEALQLKMAHSIGETLKDELGITSQSFGPGVGTPVIRGQSGPRVRVLANGIGSNDASAVSPDHATSIEPVLAERIEVLRGPATLLYGSGAIGGVVNIIDGRIPEQLPERLIGGALDQRFDSVSNQTMTALKVDGGQGNIAYHLDGFFRGRSNLDIGGYAIDEEAARQVDPTLPTDLQNTYGYIDNTSSHAISGSAGVSMVGAPGFAGVAYNYLENNYGIAPDGSGEQARIDLKQSKYDLKGELKDPFEFAQSLRVKLGFTDYEHREIADGATESFFSNDTWESRLELVHKDIGPVQGLVGFQVISSDQLGLSFHEHGDDDGHEEDNDHDDEHDEGEDGHHAEEPQTIYPQTQTNSYGVFAVESFKHGPMTYQLGARVEQTDINPEGHEDFSYTPVSGSASALWKADSHNSVNLAFTRSSRAPNVQELLSDGFHHATRSFERGNTGLQEENSYNLDLGYRFNTDWMRAEIDLFHNWADNYIFFGRNGEFVDEEGEACATGDCFPVLLSQQADATFMGYESKLVFPVMENHYGLVELTLFSDFTRGQFTSSGDVPRMPPLRFGFQIDHFLGDWSNGLRLTRGEAQNRPGDFDTQTPGYVLLGLSSQYRIKHFQDVDIMVFAKANNLLNENVRNSTSYLRNFAPEPGRGAELGVRISY